MDQDYINTGILDGQITRLFKYRNRKKIRMMKVAFGSEIQEMLFDEFGRKKTEKGMKLYWRVISKF